jgi:hypothetical protein
MVKIGILTQQLRTNYGCLLQAYALQKVLTDMGHEAWIIRREEKLYASFYWCLRIKAGDLIKRCLGKKTSKESIATYRENTDAFISDYLRPHTSIIRTSNRLKKLVDKCHFGAYVVGSDQVWRPKYSPCIDNYFLDFLPMNSKVKRISYAASFGTDDWEFTPKQTDKFSALIQRFDSISVREDSAVELCKEHLACVAIHVLDPTLLLKKTNYIQLVEKEQEISKGQLLFCYILDSTLAKLSVMERVANLLNFTPYDFLKGKEKKVPRVTQWLQSFIDAEFVVTDSFHGCVFSIIFNKSFIAIGNPERGYSRFTSLLKIFNLEERLVTADIDVANLTKLINSKIDWGRIEQIKSDWQIKSLRFIESALNDKYSFHE